MEDVVAAVTAGPGVTNSASALAQAQSGDSPLFVIGGRAPQARWGMGSLQEMDHVELVKSITKKSVTLADADVYAKAEPALIEKLLQVRRSLVDADLGQGIATPNWGVD